MNHVIANGVKQSLIDKNLVLYIIEMCQSLIEISTLADINLSTAVVLWIIAHMLFHLVWYPFDIYHYKRLNSS